MILVEIYPDSADEYRWRAKDGANGKVIADSGEGYQNISDVERMIQRVFSGETARPLRRNRFICVSPTAVWLAPLTMSRSGEHRP